MNTNALINRKKYRVQGAMLVAQAGFTLIELLVVVVIFGIVAFYAIDAFTGAPANSAKAKAIYTTATNFAKSWQLLSLTCGTSTNVASSPITGNDAARTMDLIFSGPGTYSGVTVPAAAYLACYQSSGVKPLSESITGGNGSYRHQGFAITVAGGGGSGPVISTTFATVPVNIVLPLYTQYSSDAGAASATALPAAGSTAGERLIQFGAPSGDNVPTLTVLSPI